MEGKKPLLSICIPTYNRADILDKCVASIVSQNEFESDDVELVISDNASDDNTEEIVKKYQKVYKNIYYSRNNKNIRDMNFPLVTGQASGIFRKLCNDTLIFKKGSIVKLINIVRDNAIERPVLFFLNGQDGKKKNELYVLNDFDAFVKIVSFYSTWIGGFGIWEDDYDSIEDKFSGCELSLWHTKILLEMCGNKNRYLIDNVKLFDIENPEQKNLSYGLYNVFYENYFYLYQKKIATHNLSKRTFYFLQKDILFGFFLPWIINVRYDYEKYKLSANEDLYSLIKKAYGRKIYYVLFVLRLRFLIIKRHIKKYFWEG
jgi:glycosyltransferase involved in cell wall biosynthesis